MTIGLRARAPQGAHQDASREQPEIEELIVRGASLGGGGGQPVPAEHEDDEQAEEQTCRPIAGGAESPLPEAIR